MVALGHLSTATDGHLTQYVYDGRNQLIEQTNPAGDLGGQIETF